MKRILFAMLVLLALAGLCGAQYPYYWDNNYGNPGYGWVSYPYYNTGYYNLYDAWGSYYGSSYYNAPYWTYYNGQSYNYGWNTYNPYSGYYPY
jgi:hypothetical protein